MNFLAHLYLSQGSDQIMVGNFIADFVKADATISYQKEIKLGIHFHRGIDSFTNKHSLFALSKQRLWHRHRHYSSVIVDIFYDHFLAKNWDKYSHIPLEEFARRSYATIQRFDNILPQQAKRVLPHMIANNWLVNYKKLTGIDRAMQGMARRASFPSAMAGAIEDLQKDYDNFEKDFREFFPDLTAHSESLLGTLVGSFYAESR
jgi:acyl carrier protein phosphodiesterase